LKSDTKRINHISFIMDGNGRWAKDKGLPRNMGHKEGVERAKEIVLAIKELDIPFISLYTFSKENWKRPRREITFLMNLIVSQFEKEFEFYVKNKIKIVHIGDRTGVPEKVMKAIDNVIEETKNFVKPTVMLAFNYSGKYDIIQAISRTLKDNPQNINEESFSKNLLTANYPDPDLIIRTSGEFRISNFFLWQSAYSEFFVVDKYWPDFHKEDLESVLESYNNRDRRFGGIKSE
jgi:undecaprenyl diphosphate synthase